MINKFFKLTFDNYPSYFYTYDKNKSNNKYKIIYVNSNTSIISTFDFSIPNNVIEINKEEIPKRIVNKLILKALEKNIDIK